MFSMGRILVILGVIMGQSVSDDCDILNNGMNPKVEVLGYTDVLKPRLMAISYKTGNLYMSDFIVSFVAIFKKGEVETQRINMTSYVYTLTVDSVAGRVYFGCYLGLKVYDEVKETMYDMYGIRDTIYTLFMSKRRTIYALTRHNKVFSRNYNVTPSKWVNMSIPFYGNEERKLIVDSDDNFYFQSSKLFHNKTTQALLKGQTEPIRYANDDAFTSLVTDHEGKAYGVAWDGVYRLESGTNIPQLAFSLLGHSPYVIAFDENNNVIFVTEDGKVVVLKYESKCSSKPKNNVSLVAHTETSHNMSVKFDELLLKLNNMEKRNQELENKISVVENQMNKFDKKSETTTLNKSSNLSISTEENMNKNN